MKKNILFYTVLMFCMIISCKFDQKMKTSFSMANISLQEYNAYGAEVISDQIYDINAMTEKYKNIKENDTIDITFTGRVTNVCQAKGCWMKIDIGNQKEAMVKFKNYEFFVPTDTAKDSVIVQGRAYVSETSVDELKHLANDAGKSADEIAAITSPKRVYSFIADGVLIKK